jgi:hypothetical protein
MKEEEEEEASEILGGKRIRFGLVMTMMVRVDWLGGRTLVLVSFGGGGMDGMMI